MRRRSNFPRSSKLMRQTGNSILQRWDMIQKSIPFLSVLSGYQRTWTRFVVDSLKKFNYTKTTPLLTVHLGPAYVGVADSGINHLVAPPQRGRPASGLHHHRKLVLFRTLSE